MLQPYSMYYVLFAVLHYPQSLNVTAMSLIGGAAVAMKTFTAP